MLPHQLTNSQLVDYLRQQIEAERTRTTAVLIVELRRANRLDAMMGEISPQLIMEHVDRRLDALLRDADRFSHFGGEQILLVLSNLANKDHSVLAAVRIISELKKSFTVDMHTVLLRPYVGIANYPDVGRDTNELLMYADIALARAATSELGYYAHQPTDIIEPKGYSGLDIEIDKALRSNELRVNYQPKIDIKTGRCISAEALVRWTAPWGKEVNPTLLVGTAEDSGMINPLTLWVLNTSLRHAAGFHKEKVNIGLSVNLPPKMLEDEELPQIIQQALEMWGVPASVLTLEITESSMIRNIESSIAMLLKLKELGVRLSIDDFGTGYSSLAYLKRLPVHELKIDILFVKNIHNSIGDKQLVRTIIDLAHNFDLVTVAEGVEDQQTFDLLRELGCDIAQGFLFSQALSETDLISWYQQRV